MGATMKDAIIKSMKMYWKGEKDHEALETSKDRKFTKKYFDSLNPDAEPKMEEVETRSKKRGY